MIAGEPEAQASDGSKVHHLAQASEPQQHVYIPSDLHDKVQQIQANLPQSVKEQLHAFAGRVIANPNPVASGNKSPVIPPALAAIAAQLSPEQIKSLASVFLNVQKQQQEDASQSPSLPQQQQQQQQQAAYQPSMAAFTLPEAPFSLAGFQQKAPLLHPQQQQQAQQQQQQQQPSSSTSGSLRHRFHFRNPFKSAPANSGHQEESRNVPFMFFGDGGAGRGVSSFFRRPRLIPTSSHLHGESEIPASHGESTGPEIQFIPLDGRPNGSPHMDQIEHMLSAALRPDAHAAGETNEANNQPIIHLNGQHENPASGHYTVVPVGVPIASAHPSLMPGVQEGTFLPSMPLNHNQHGLVFEHNAPQMVRQAHRVAQNVRHHQNGQRRPGIGLPKLVSPPELGSAYSNGWIPKDLPQDWSPGPIRTPSPTASSEYDAFTKFTAADSITPRPPVASSSVSRFTPPGQALRPVSVTTPHPAVSSSTEKSEVDEIYVEEARHEENRSKQQPKDKKKEFKQQENPRKKNATDSVKLTGKQQLIKLWLSQTQTPQDAVEVTTAAVSTSTVVAASSPSQSGVSSRQGKALKDSIKPSVTVSVSASLNPTVQVDRARLPTAASRTAATTTSTTTTTTASSVIVPVTASSHAAVAAGSTVVPAALSSTNAPVVAAAASTNTPTTSTTTPVPSTAAAVVTVASEVPFRPSVPRYSGERIIKSTTTTTTTSSTTTAAVTPVSTVGSEDAAKMEPIPKVAKEGVIESIDSAKENKEIAKINDKDDLAKIWSTASGKVSTSTTGDLTPPSSSTSPEPVYLNH